MKVLSYKDINIKSSYETGEDDLLESFYLPVLENAAKYDRIAGFFSSSSLAIASKGIAGLIKNKGKMRLIACPKLSEDDIKIINEVVHNKEGFLEKNLIDGINNIEDSFQNDHVKALGWMLVQGLLEIKIAIPISLSTGIFNKAEKGIFHQKVGLLEDIEGNKISFSGSINETASAWLDNIEEFKVFKSWIQEQDIYVQDDIKKVNEFWNNNRLNVKVINLPNAVKANLIEKSNDFNLDSLISKRYKKYSIYKRQKDCLNLFYYQKDAIEMWKQNQRQLLFAMATGTGKTRTAIGCIVDALFEENKLLIIVSCPQGTLSLQWENEINKLNIPIDTSKVIDGTNSNWKKDLKEIILSISIGYYNNAIIYTTHSTCSKQQFIHIIKDNIKSVRILFIGDEAHGLGALKMRKGLLEIYDYRIGLSATPSRWYDENGTELLDEYFGNKNFEFSITDALNKINPLTGKTFLVNYYYKISFIELTDEELIRYMKLSTDIKKLKSYKKSSDEYAERIERLLFKRANIIKNANNKYSELKRILGSIDSIQDMIIFVSDEQIDMVLEILNFMQIPAHKLTQEEGTVPESKYGGLTERQFIIQKFKEGHYKVLVAIKVLDEGIDIPSANKAILMASSTNPREYIQRIGRVIRQYGSKKNAKIYDISVKPCFNKIGSDEIRRFEKAICDKEKVRLKEIATNAINNSEALITIEENMEG